MRLVLERSAEGRLDGRTISAKALIERSVLDFRVPVV
jgi:hypothetical protein